MPNPSIVPLGDGGLLVRFATILSDEANRAAIAFAQTLQQHLPVGVTEIDPNLISVLLKYDQERVCFEQLAGEVRLLLGRPEKPGMRTPQRHRIAVRFGGDEGPDLEDVAAGLGLSVAAFVAAHNEQPLRVLTTGFAPGFVYCGFHPDALIVPRRRDVRASVPPGTLLFAAGQSAITATTLPTGWHVIGHTEFRNFEPAKHPPTVLAEGDEVTFEPER